MENGFALSDFLNLYHFIHDILYVHVLCVLLKKPKTVTCCTKNCCVNKNYIYVSRRGDVAHKNYVSHKKYLVATKTIMWQPKEGLMLTKCGCCCKEKGFLLTKSSSYMLYWLKKFCVKRKKLWCRTRIKVGVHKCY